MFDQVIETTFQMQHELFQAWTRLWLASLGEPPKDQKKRAEPVHAKWVDQMGGGTSRASAAWFRANVGPPMRDPQARGPTPQPVDGDSKEPDTPRSEVEELKELLFELEMTKGDWSKSR